MNICKHCGKDEIDHCVFEERSIPENCYCDLDDWEGVDINPICLEYKPGTFVDNCENCNHSSMCHEKEET